MPNIETTYKQLIDNIGSTLLKARENAFKAINHELVKANWEIGRHIVEFEQNGKQKAQYGSSLLTNLSKDLKNSYEKGFGKSNIYLFRQFYLKYPIFRTVSGKLSWSHYAELLTISNEHSRKFYEKTGGLSNKIFVSKYQLYLPNQEQLENKVKQIINND